MLFAKAELEKAGFKVTSNGLEKDDNGDIFSADAVLLPVPFTRDMVNINCPLTDKKIPLNILQSLPQKTKIFGGGKFEKDNYTDYLSLDEYAIKNAVLTAEGAIAAAVQKTDFSLWESRILVIGYGRVGKVLTDRLSGFCGELTVSARSGRDISMIKALGINHLYTPNISDCAERFDIVFNTVDIKFDYSVAAVFAGAHFFDLSSRGGFIGDTAVKHGIRYEPLPAIPAKTAPVTAGKIIAETVIELLK